MFSTRSVVLQRIAPLLFVCLWSSAFIAIRGGLPDVSPLFFLTTRFTLATAVLLAVAAIIRTGRAAVGSLVYLALVASLGAMVPLMFMLRSGNAGKVASNFYLKPPV